jgi:DNA-binding XRE family transcriptional regulator
MRKFRLSAILTDETYTLQEAADLLGVSRQTVAQWEKEGLPVMGERVPKLAYGADLKAFLQKRESARKQKMQAGEMYCLSCKAASVPAEGRVFLSLLNQKRALLSGVCTRCGGRISRIISAAQLPEARERFCIQEQGIERSKDAPHHCLNLT